MTDKIRPKTSTLILYLVIPVALFIFSVFVPLIAALVYSFTKYQGPAEVVSFGINYKDLFVDSIFWKAFSNNLFLVGACIVGQIGFAFIFVLMIQSRLVKVKGIHRTFGFFPSTISAVSIGFIWEMIYDYKNGIINWLFDAIGREDLKRIWLGEEKTIMLVLSIPLIWQWIGYYMVILLSAISAIDTEIFEVAEIDGANGFQRAIYIVLPLIKNTLLVCITLCIAGNMKAFDNIYVMTAGGPGTSSMVMAMYGYQQFQYGDLGYSSTVSVAIFILSLLVIGGAQWLIKGLTKKSDY